MTKVFFILSAVVILVSCVFAYQNGQDFTTVRKTVAGHADSIKTEEAASKKVITSISVVRGDIARVEGEIEIEAEKLKAQRNKLAQAEGEAQLAQKEYDTKAAEQKELAAKLAKLPKDVKVETLSEDINRLKKEKLEFEAQAEAKKKEVTAEEEKVAGIQARVDAVVHKIEERRKNFDRNSLSSRVLAVNHEWGFVVIDAGKSTGLTEETKLIVTRAGHAVGKISVMNVDSGRSMAAIVPGSVNNGEVIMPGDRVILENLVQN